MSNENCLKGIRCPECGSAEPFNIVALATFLVYDTGTDRVDDVEWDDDSRITCTYCGMQGQVKDFKEQEDVGTKQD